MKKYFLGFFLLLISLPTHAYQPAVVSAHPDATRAGLEILKNGGSAADAAIATAFALSVVEPYYSGLGGGGLFLYFDAKTRRLHFVDYRESSPAAASAAFFKANPEKSKSGITSAAVPGFVKGMEVIHKKWRRVSWPAVVEPAIRLAQKGLPIGGRLRDKIGDRKEDLEKDPAMKEIFLSSARVNQKDLAATLEDLKTGGAELFYQGALARKIADFSKKSGGLITLGDLNNYRVYFREPHQFSYRGYEITSSSLPSSGGKGMDLMFRRAIINDLPKESPYSPRAYEMLAKILQDYLEFREIGFGDSPIKIVSHTTHISVIDQEGNMAAMTNTLNSPFGAGVMVPGTGIILNNEMDDFSLKPQTANPVRPGVRPLSSMAPTIIFKGGHPYLIIGTPGGLTIPQNLFQVLFYTWEWETPLGQAIRQSKIYYSPASEEVVVEKRLSGTVKKWLRTQFKVREDEPMGNVQALQIQDSKHTIPYSDIRGEGRGLTLPVVNK